MMKSRPNVQRLFTTKHHVLYRSLAIYLGQGTNGTLVDEHGIAHFQVMTRPDIGTVDNQTFAIGCYYLATKNGRVGSRNLFGRNIFISISHIDFQQLAMKISAKNSANVFPEPCS